VKFALSERIQLTSRPVIAAKAGRRFAAIIGWRATARAFASDHVLGKVGRDFKDLGQCRLPSLSLNKESQHHAHRTPK
jgi:hypothetical protein